MGTKYYYGELMLNDKRILTEDDMREAMGDSPFAYGEGDLSAILEDSSNRAIAASAVALGANTIAGSKGFRYIQREGFSTDRSVTLVSEVDENDTFVTYTYVTTDDAGDLV